MSGSSHQQEGHESPSRVDASGSSPLLSNSQSHLSANWTARPRPAGASPTSHDIATGQLTGQASGSVPLDTLPASAHPSTTSFGSSSRLGGSLASLFSRNSGPKTATSASGSTPTSASGSNPTSASGSNSTQSSSGSSRKFRQVAVATCEKLETALRGLRTTANVLPPIRSVIDEVIECLGGLQTIMRNEDLTQIELDVQSMIRTLDGFLNNLNPDEDNALIADISMSVKAKIENMDKMRGHIKGKRLLESAKYEQDIIKCSLYVKDLIQQLQSKTILQTWHSTHKQHTLRLLRSLSPAHDALYNSTFSRTIKRHGCTTQTREEIQKDLHDWARDAEATKVYWMSGMAGTGKTTIAYSLCDWLKDAGLLGASFFCSGSSPSCRKIEKVVPTIAHQLAQSLPRFRSELCKVLEDELDVATSDIGRQFEQLLERPLMAAKVPGQAEMVVVIDALDECQVEREGSSRMREFFETLFRLAARLPLKFFVTSRPDSALHDRILSRRTPSESPRPNIRLHEIEQSLVEADITKYLTNALSTLMPPPSFDQINLLAKRAGKLFIYAATVVNFVMSDTVSGNSTIRLESILSLPEGDSESHIKYNELDRLYAKIISTAFRGLLNVEKEIRESVLWTSICAGEPVTIETLASLAGHGPEKVISALQPLQSVLYISEGTNHVSPLHSSFPEFMLDRTRSRKHYFDQSKHSHLLSKHCLEVMKSQLTFNICQLGSSFLFDSDITDLEDRVTKHIPAVLYYACSYWSMHLKLSSTSDTLRNMVTDFLSHRLLFWMEVLNLKGCMDAAPGILLQAQDWFLANGSHDNTPQFIAEARLFVTRFAISACALSTPHLYISALPLCPKSSLVYQAYSEKTKANQPLSFEGIDKLQSKQATLLTLQTQSMRNVMAVAFSPDGSQIASGSKDGHVRLWSTHTGRIITTRLMKHSASVLSVAFSPDGTRLASGSIDCTVKVWNINPASEAIEVTKEHTDWVRSIGFSPNGEQIVSGSHDRTVRIWNSRTGQDLIAPLRGHTGWVTSVAFSPDGTQVVSTSDDFTIRLWDVRTGAAIGYPFQGHSSWVRCVAYSPDGSRIASGSHDNTILVRDARTGALITGPLKGHTGPVNSITFSPDGNQILSGSDDRTIRMWDTCSGALIAGPIKGHTGPIRSIAFSPDNSKFISSSDDCTIRVWDANAVTAAINDDERAVPGHTKAITAVALSPDGERIASGSHDRTILVWSIESSRIEIGPLKGHKDSIMAIAFSPNGKLIASGSDDYTVLVWDAQTGTIVATPCIGHILSVKSVAFSPDGSLLASGSDDCTIRVWEVISGSQVAGPFTEYPDHIRLVAFSTDGSRVVSSSADHTVQVWDLGSGRIIGRPSRQGMHEGSPLATAFSSDGTRLAYGTDHYSIQVRDIRTGARIGRPCRGHTSTVMSVALSADGSLMISGSSDRTIRVWRPNQSTNATLKNPWCMNNNGWVTAGNSALFWVPPDLHDRVPCFPGTLTLGPEGTSAFRINRWDLLGENWANRDTSG